MYCCDGKAEFSTDITSVFSVTQSSRNHFNADFMPKRHVLLLLLSVLKSFVLDNTCQNYDSFIQGFFYKFILLFYFHKLKFEKIKNIYFVYFFILLWNKAFMVVNVINNCLINVAYQFLFFKWLISEDTYTQTYIYVFGKTWWWWEIMTEFSCSCELYLKYLHQKHLHLLYRNENNTSDQMLKTLQKLGLTLAHTQTSKEKCLSLYITL